jgi:hypothetical protein
MGEAPLRCLTPRSESKGTEKKINKKATRDRVNNVSHSNRHYCLIADYSQKLNLPHFGNTQPRETYFYTPLTLYLFGVVDTSNNDHNIILVIYSVRETAKRVAIV